MCQNYFRHISQGSICIMQALSFNHLSTWHESDYILSSLIHQCCSGSLAILDLLESVTLAWAVSNRAVIVVRTSPGCAPLLMTVLSCPAPAPGAVSGDLGALLVCYHLCMVQGKWMFLSHHSIWSQKIKHAGEWLQVAPDPCSANTG